MSATGNDFIVIDNLNLKYSAQDNALWEKLCERRTNIGADGVLLVEPSEKYDFKMRYINADGGEVSMCGNGARAISMFYYAHINNKSTHLTFETLNGVYTSSILGQRVKLLMSELYDVDKIDISSFFYSENSLYLDTGVPHCVYEVKDVNSINVNEYGRKIRFENVFKNGTNVNFYEILDKNAISIRTYERGVENETLSCGTGITATAFAYRKIHNSSDKIKIQSRGGDLIVEFLDKDIYLIGDVREIFSATYSD